MKIHTLLYSILGMALLSNRVALGLEPTPDENPMTQSQIFTSNTTVLDTLHFRRIPDQNVSAPKTLTCFESETTSSDSDYKYQAPERWLKFSWDQVCKFRFKTDKETADTFKVHPNASYYINLPILLATVKEIVTLTSSHIKYIDYINSPEGYKILQELQEKKSIAFPHALYQVAFLFDLVGIRRHPLELLLEVDYESSLKLRKVIKKFRNYYIYKVNNPQSAG